MKSIKRIAAILLSLTMILCLCSCADNSGDASVGSDNKDVSYTDGWATTWGTAMLTAGPNETPMKPALKENTCRQQIRVSIGGDKLRLTLSNEFGDIPVQIDSIHIAHLVGPNSSAIDTATDTAITFNGEASVKIEPGTKVTSDEIAFSFEALDDLAITSKFGKYAGGGTITSHTAARATTWIVEGDHVTDEAFTGAEEMISWYFINGLEVWAKAGTKTVVCIGDSITDGASSAPNSFSRYSDELARLCQANEATKDVAVVAKGIGGTVIENCTGRFDNDVINVLKDTPGDKYCIIMIGINNIGGAQDECSDYLIERYEEMIKKCHDNGIKVYGGVLTPIKGSGYYSELHDKSRTKLNEFIKSKKSGFDGIIDFEAAVCDPDDHAKIADVYALGSERGSWSDYLHPNGDGYVKMGETAYEALKDELAK